MIGQFFPQRRNLFGRHRTRVVSPLASFVSKNVGDFLVGQCFVPRLHHSSAKLLSFHFDRTLQTFQHNHCQPSRAAGRKFRACQRWILSGNTETVRLMASLTVGRKNFLATISTELTPELLPRSGQPRQFSLTSAAPKRIETITGKISRIAAQIRTAQKGRQTISCDQPNRERLQSNTRFAFLSLNRCMHFLDIRGFAIIHSLAS